MRLMIRPNHLPHLLVVMITLTLAFASMPGSAQQQGVNADFWEKYDDISDWVTLRLQLTPEQEDVVLPIMKESFAEKKAVLEAYGLLSDAKINLTPKQRGEIGAQLASISAQTLQDLRGKVNQKQLKEAGRIQHEFLREFSARLRARTAQGG